MIKSSAIITQFISAIYHDITDCTTIKVAESKPDFRITIDTHSYGVSIVRIVERIDRVITAPHCMCVVSTH